MFPKSKQFQRVWNLIYLASREQNSRRSGFLNNKHATIHLPGVEVLSLSASTPPPQAAPPGPLVSEENTWPGWTNLQPHCPGQSGTSGSRHVTQAGPAFFHLFLSVDVGREEDGVSVPVCPCLFPFSLQISNQVDLKKNWQSPKTVYFTSWGSALPKARSVPALLVTWANIFEVGFIICN